MEEKYNKEVISGIEDLKKLLESEEDGYNSYNEVMEILGLDLKDLENQMVDNTKIILEYTSKNEKELRYNYPSDSGFDLFSNDEIIIPPFGRALIPTGVKINIPENYELQIRSKSGLAINQGLMVLNSPGTVDCFSEDMKILTIDGEKLISEIKIGEIVFSFNESTFEIEKDSIVQIFNTEEQEILQIETEYGILEITPNSEVYTKNGIILAKNLVENDEIICFF